MSANYVSSLSGTEMDSAFNDLNNHTTLYGAEAWARGTKGGVDVGSTDPTFHNNARYYAEVAQSAVPSENGAVLWNQSQNLVESEKKQGRLNIGAINGDIVAMRGWNQLVRNGNFANASNWTGSNGTLSVSNNVASLTYNTSLYNHRIIQDFATPLVTGRKYLFCMYAKGTSNINKLDSIIFNPGNFILNGATLSTDFSFISDIFVATNNSTQMMIAGKNTPSGSSYEGEVLSVKSVNLIDLTALFGSGNEPSTVAEFRSMFPSDYYPYCQGGFGDLLWTNASPTSAFVGQSISVDLGSYRHILIYYSFSGSAYGQGHRISSIVRVGNGGIVMLTQNVDSTTDSLIIAVRAMSSSFSEITFENEYSRKFDGTPLGNVNSLLAPYQIYGIR